MGSRNVPTFPFYRKVDILTCKTISSVCFRMFVALLLLISFRDSFRLTLISPSSKILGITGDISLSVYLTQGATTLVINQGSDSCISVLLFVSLADRRPYQKKLSVARKFFFERTLSRV